MAARRRAARDADIRPSRAPQSTTDPARHDLLKRDAMALYKQALATGAEAPLAAFLDGAVRADRSAVAPLLALLQAERARLVKLRSLGQTGDFEERLGLTDRLIRTVRSGGVS